ncbi:hypothetical protein [Halocatena salina]|uniref:Uncharacterized protein n=1 Tax=Halocatena salina TaxID=2934340 RepID=A0A8T9ZZI7_9EURY|nr:hypothetical protein [Halocatena salina]UPM41926.1 hypothetical protein MW046_08065 [Halocatena salina]
MSRVHRATLETLTVDPLAIGDSALEIDRQPSDFTEIQNYFEPPTDRRM